MSRRTKRRMGARRSSGFTLVELMLTVTMLSIVMYLTMESLNRQQKTSIVTDQIVEVQNNVRAVAGLIERELRMAGFMVPDAAGACGIDRTTGSDELFISEIEMIVPDDERSGTLGARLSSAQSWNGTGVHNLDSTTTDLDGDGALFYDNDGNGTPDADFRVGGGFIAADAANPARGVVCGVVTAASTTQITLSTSAGTLAAHVASSDAPEDIVIVPAAHYRITTSANGTTQLTRNGDLLAKGVEDFQISWYFDSDGDGVIDAGEEFGATSANPYNASNHANDELQEVRFAIVVRTRATDPTFDGGQFRNFENRAAVAGSDNYRRRVIAGRVRPRNIGQTGSI